LFEIERRTIIKE